MQSGQFSTEQIITILDQAERTEESISTICRASGMSESTCTQRVPGWRKQFEGMSVNEAQRLREPGAPWAKEHARLKRLLAARDLEVDALTALLAKKV